MTPLKIVLVDDDKSLLQTLTLNLEDAGFDVSAYHLGASAVIDIPNEKPDCVITDISMDGLDGLSMIEELRKSTDLSDTKYIVISGNEGDDWERKAIVAGARAYFKKPIELATFALRVKAILRG